ncbi:MAG: FAD-dependent oxidoreductase [Sphingomonadaceae bacterium]
MDAFDEQFDFVVVGSGGGSMAAGLVMRQAGRSVLILEKTDLIGGSTAKAGGVMWIPANKYMAQAGVADTIEQGEAYLNAVVEAREGDAPGTSRERRRTYITEANAMIDFLERQGIEFERAPLWPDYYDDRDGGTAGRTVHAKVFDLNRLGEWKAKLRKGAFGFPLPIYEITRLPLIKRSWQARRLAAKAVLKQMFEKLTGKEYATAGTALQGRMLQAAVREGVELRTGADVKQVLQNAGGRVTGVEVEIDGAVRRIGAKLGVLLNAGGFSHNQEMRDKYIPHTKVGWTHTAPGDTGDMHRELMRLGAHMAQMEEMVGNQMMLPPGADPGGAQMQLAKPHAFMVDQTGVRYMSEGGSYMLFCQSMLERHKTVPAVPSWMVMDSQFMRDHMLATSMPGSTRPAEWFTTGFLKKGATIEELAGEIGCDPATLKASTERFNGFARAGRDEDFGRGRNRYDAWLGDDTHQPNASLGTVEVGPFYAVQIVPGDVGTFGGAVTDSSARVLREDGSAIEGLYATGTTSAAVMGRTYPGAGCSIGPSFTFGFVAAKHAAGLGNAGV